MINSLLALLKTLVVVRQNYRKPSLWEVIDSFVLLALASLIASVTLLKITSLFELYFSFRRFILLVQTINDLYELWQQHKLLKTMEMREACSEIYNERYRHQFQPGSTPKIH